MIRPSSKVHTLHVIVKVKYNDTRNFHLISTTVAKTLETAYPEEEIRASIAAGCSECVLSAHTSTTPYKMLLIIQCLRIFLKQLPQRMSWRGSEWILEKRVCIHGKLPRWALGQGSKKKNNSESRTVGFCLAKPKVAPDVRAGWRDRGAFHNCLFKRLPLYFYALACFT